MKQIRKTTAKTRAGILKWLGKFNTAHHIQALDHSSAVAAHVNKWTGIIVYWEMPTGALIPATFTNIVEFSTRKAA